MELFDEIQSFLATAKVEDDFEELQLDNILSTIEVEKLILSFAAKRGDIGFTEDEAVEITRWAESVRIQEALLDLVLKDLATVDLNKDNEPVFSLTSRGSDIAESLVEDNE